MAQHQKHAKLARPQLGHFARQEWAIIGAPCGLIQQLALDLIARLSPSYHVGYVDADHQSADADASLAQGAVAAYTDKIGFHRLDRKTAPSQMERQLLFEAADLVLVNGNHFEAQRQIVVVHPAKADSLQRKLDRLTSVSLVLLAPGTAEMHPFLREHLGDNSGIPVLPMADTAAIADLLHQEMLRQQPPLHGLVLAGGRSERMGEDKGAIEYHGKPQREHAADLLAAHCAQVFISCRPEQVGLAAHSPYPTLPDTITGLGPYGAILSAFRDNPNCAWLVVACDLPLLDGATLAQLCSQRAPSKVATAFNSPDHEFPEPLVTIWEPRSYPLLLRYLAQGYSCPRKVLINADIARIDAARPTALTNVNTPDDRKNLVGEIKAV